MKKIILVLFLPFLLFSKEFTIASYNIENLFDLTKDGTEYKEFIPNKTNWNSSILEKKLKNSARVLNDVNADIVAIQEVESLEALKLLQKKIPQYNYINFIKNKKSAVGLGILSKYKILGNSAIKIRSNSKIERPIQKVIIQIEKNKNITIYNNHWRSKRASESKRIAYAQSLIKYLKNITKNEDYVLIGDFNSNYDEFETIKFNKKLNNTQGITGINQVLNTTLNGEYISKRNILNYTQKVHYNLWLDLPYEQRYSYFYKGRKNAPDNIIISPALFDNENISYVNNSFKVFKPNYLINGKKINRWKMNKNYHKGQGYSDHLPIIATFSTTPSKQNSIKKIKITEEEKNKIAYLYTIDKLEKPVVLKNAVVIYKENNNAIIKQNNNRAIFVFNSAKSLEIGKSYDIKALKIKNHFGLKEILKLEALKENSNTYDVKQYFKDGNKIDLLNLTNQNEIITNLKGIYQSNYLYYKNKKIRIYSKNKELLPKDGQEITINEAHLGYFKEDPQLIIYKKSDYNVN